MNFALNKHSDLVGVVERFKNILMIKSKLKLAVAIVLLMGCQCVLAQNDLPNPFDDTPPDFVPEAPIDQYIYGLFLFGLAMIIYYMPLGSIWRPNRKKEML